MKSGLDQIPNTDCVIAAYFFYSSNNIDLTSTDYSRVTSWCALGETSSVAVNGKCVQIMLIWSPCPLWLFSSPFSREYRTATLTHCVYTSKPFQTHCIYLMLMYLYLHTHQRCFWHRSLFEKTGLNLLIWKSLGPCSCSQAGPFAPCISIYSSTVWLLKCWQ